MTSGMRQLMKCCSVECMLAFKGSGENFFPIFLSRKGSKTGFPKVLTHKTGYKPRQNASNYFRRFEHKKTPEMTYFRGFLSFEIPINACWTEVTRQGPEPFLRDSFRSVAISAFWRLLRTAGNATFSLTREDLLPFCSLSTAPQACGWQQRQ